MKMYDAVVIGAGAAGMTAAIYLKRSNLDVVILEKNAPGGVMNLTSTIDNYPGIAKVNGVDLSMSMYNQMLELDIEYKATKAFEIEDHQTYKVIKTDNDEIMTKTVIVATGRVAKKLGLPNEDSLIGRGISFCAICDGFFYKGKDVAIIGGGNSAIEEASYLTGVANKIYIINRSSELKADQILIDKLKKYNNIEFIMNESVKELVKENNKLVGIILNSGKSLTVDGLFLYIGYDPDVKCFIKNKIELDSGYIKVNSKMQTSLEGVYACGDVIKKDVYQITTATGEATIAATSVKEYLSN